ncbi:hypothetical protein [Pseudobdellovibrio exovorus]|uniref:Uncharacterized protein n=1 Tax=Pseudobdellovibrio exovorus JSS TaxID=1184267 RepID=M4VBF7_9BACT|nr:hypothetical protein [Pseudobdellovibrio exovorus]AGH95820.1 hypothetical protein A11Q_1604 [Pseudobdellovibrio exovorus JSS]
MIVLIDIDRYISLLENSIEDLREEKNMARVSELLQANWLEQNIDMLIAEEIESTDCDKNIFNESVKEQFEQYGIEKGGAVPSETVSNETALRKRIIYLRALKKVRR